MPLRVMRSRYDLKPHVKHARGRHRIKQFQFLRDNQNKLYSLHCLEQLCHLLEEKYLK
jgi:hypothetical protein